ncbi:MAG: biopolymer transporter ExbD [Alphaproteobacteria bacterium]|nr:biopolymer transporter ExbD [Alphaproteobacteria bacterium]
MARTHQTETGELNLLPVMNLVTILIPLLLMGVTLVNLATIDSSLPGISDEPGLDGPPPLHLSIAITTHGFRVQSEEVGLAGPSIEPVELPCAGERCADPQAYDYSGLTDALARVKDAFPDHQSVVLVPDNHVPYEVLVGVMDASRAQAERHLFPQVTIAGGAG